MEDLIASYPSSDSESDDSPSGSSGNNSTSSRRRPISDSSESVRLPPPQNQIDLLDLPPSLACFTYPQVNRVRSFPHVEGNYALHVFIPVHIPSTTKKELAYLVKNVASLVPGLHAVDIDIPLSDLCKEDERLEQVLLGREFHISLGRTVPVRVHQIDSLVAMLRERFQSQRRYLIEFNNWEVFINDDRTRSFLSLEVKREGLSEITRQIRVVDDIYKLHGLPEFYKNSRPHISLTWALGDISYALKQAVEELEIRRYKEGGSSSRKQHIFSCKFSGIECRIGKKSYTICKFRDYW